MNKSWRMTECPGNPELSTRCCKESEKHDEQTPKQLKKEAQRLLLLTPTIRKPSRKSLQTPQLAPDLSKLSRSPWTMGHFDGVANDCDFDNARGSGFSLAKELMFLIFWTVQCFSKYMMEDVLSIFLFCRLLQLQKHELFGASPGLQKAKLNTLRGTFVLLPPRDHRGIRSIGKSDRVRSRCKCVVFVKQLHQAGLWQAGLDGYGQRFIYASWC